MKTCNMLEIINRIDNREKKIEQIKQDMYFLLSQIEDKKRLVRIGLEAQEELKELNEKFDYIVSKYKEVM